MNYPNRIIKLGETDAELVKAIKVQLNQKLVLASSQALDTQNPNFGTSTKQMVKLFQSRFTDHEGNPLKIDGEIGLLTWNALFETAADRQKQAASALLKQVIAMATVEKKKNVREHPKNSNRGKEVDAYLQRAGAGLGLSWCCAFVYWCFDEAAKKLQKTNPMIKTAGCLAHWNGAGKKGIARITAAQAQANPQLIKVGMVFIMDYGKGLGHTGIVIEVSDGWITTIEGNTDASLSREGGGVYQLKRKINSINKGFIDYSSF
ncbi:CHAP domain-containing protein [Agitococcus lubricus]|uniref:CHAP domain-containing protein n=1 Tax=Agitococcus lubricus TaxID=1077255 RepID=A0A2T5IYE7_9GAMM|nr:CHAP domain-containing protein [Agitococcus lubricus]PTQ88949.1 CHAP domain-containing protein [Agitococcus lubricus]